MDPHRPGAAPRRLAIVGAPIDSDQVDRVALGVLLERAPDGVDVAGLALQLTAGSRILPADVTCAIDRLVDDGLAWRDAGVVRASRAAIRFDTLGL